MEKLLVIELLKLEEPLKNPFESPILAIVRKKAHSQLLWFSLVTLAVLLTFLRSSPQSQSADRFTRRLPSSIGGGQGQSIAPSSALR